MSSPRFLPALLALSVIALGAPKAPKAAKADAPTLGVKTPGVLIPFSTLKSEAELALTAPPAGILFTESIAVADASGIRRFDAKTNKPFDPPRDIKDLDKPCGGMVSAFSFVWMPLCGKSSLAKLEMRPVRAPGAGRGPRPAAAPPAAEAAPGAKPEPAKPEAPKTAEAAAKPEPPAAPRTPPAPPAFIETGAVPVAATAVAASADSIWLLADAKTSLQRIDPVQNAIVAEMRLPAGCTSIVSAESALWVTCPSEAKILRIDPRTNLVDKRIEVPAQPVSVAAGESSIWVLCRKEGKVARIDPKTNKITATIELGVPNAEGMLAFGDGSLWASLPGFPVIRIAPATDKVVQQFHGEGGGMIHFGLGSVWVASATSSSVSRFDPKRVAATLAE